MNTELIGLKKTDNYRVYTSPFVVEHSNTLIEIAGKAHTNFKTIFKDADSTWTYNRYNLFSLTAREPMYYILYRQIVAAIRDTVGDDRALWMQCWLNYHQEHEVLDWHGHDETYNLHGYLSLDPKDTVTEFRGFTIENKVGNLYIGRPGKEMDHRVVVKTPYTGNRITIAFDVCEGRKIPHIIPNLSFIPI